MKQNVSILVAAFNAERWIDECLNSALQQSWPEKEIIVVDDGSTDRTYEIAASYRPEIHLVKIQHRGACAARNHAFSLAQGDYIQWLDADDLLAADKVETQIKDAEPGASSEVLLSCPWGEFLVCPQRTRFSPTPLWEDLDPVEWLFRKIDLGSWMAPETWLVSRHLTEKAGPWNENLARDQDGEYFCRVLMSATSVRFVPNAKVFKRGRIAGSISDATTVSDEKRESTIFSLQTYLRTLLAAEDSKRTRNACEKLLNRWALYFFPERLDLLSELKVMAKEIGGHVSDPKLSGKYRILQLMFGWNFAKKAKIILPRIRDRLLICWEGVLCTGQQLVQTPPSRRFRRQRNREHRS